MTPDLQAVVALLRLWAREHRSGSIEIVFGDGTAKRVNEVRTTSLRKHEAKTEGATA